MRSARVRQRAPCLQAAWTPAPPSSDHENSLHVLNLRRRVRSAADWQEEDHGARRRAEPHWSRSIEFDYCCVHAAMAMREDGCETIMVSCNPETVSTDYDTSDRLYFEPVTLEDVLGNRTR